MPGAGPTGPLPASWARDELVLDEREHWAVADWSGGDDAVCVLFDPIGGSGPVTDQHGRPVAGDPESVTPGQMLLAVGRSDRVGTLAAAALDREIAARRPLASAWIATEALPPLLDRLAALGLRPRRTGWEWMVIRDRPAPVPAEHRLRPLTPADRDATSACLAVANPATEAIPVADGERWWGVGTPGGPLLGVIGAEQRPGAIDGAGSWHLHGLGVRPEARGQGLGGALTAGAARALLAEGADWVSLGMWDDNAGARRIYHRLGFRTVHRLVTLHRD